MKLHVFGYDLFTLVRKPDEVARLAMLVARADVDARLTACDELSLAPQLRFLFQDCAVSAEDFEVLVGRGQVWV